MKTTDYKKIADGHFNRVQVPEGLERHLSELIDDLDKQQIHAVSEKASKAPRFRPLRSYAALAASLAIIAALAITLIDRHEHTAQYALADTCATPEEARIELEKAISLIAASCSKASGIINESTESIPNPKEIINQTLNHNESNN